MIPMTCPSPPPYTEETWETCPDPVNAPIPPPLPLPVPIPPPLPIPVPPPLPIPVPPPMPPTSWTRGVLPEAYKSSRKWEMGLEKPSKIGLMKERLGGLSWSYENMWFIGDASWSKPKTPSTILPPIPDWDRCFERLVNHVDLKEFISNKRQERKRARVMERQLKHKSQVLAQLVDLHGWRRGVEHVEPVVAVEDHHGVLLPVRREKIRRRIERPARKFDIYERRVPYELRGKALLRREGKWNQHF
jgi:hypothetical protein